MAHYSSKGTKGYSLKGKSVSPKRGPITNCPFVDAVGKGK